jgi:hypothetical protein
MLHSSENSFNPKSGSPASNPNAFNPVKNVTAPVDQATIGRTLFIKGEISGSEALYIDGRIEGKITMPRAASPSDAMARLTPASRPAKSWSWAK